MAVKDSVEYIFPIDFPSDWPSPNVNFLLAFNPPMINPASGREATWRSMSQTLNNRFQAIAEDRIYDLAPKSNYIQQPKNGMQLGYIEERDPTYFDGYMDDYSRLISP